MADLAGRLAAWALGPHPVLDVLLVPGMLLLALVFLLALWAIQGARLALLLAAGGAAVLWLRERTRGDVMPHGIRRVDQGRPVRRGGYSSEYAGYMASPEWRRRRARILRRDRRRCRSCGARATDVHHRWYSSPIGAEPDAALEALCVGCHQRAHGR